MTAMTDFTLYELSQARQIIYTQITSDRKYFTIKWRWAASVKDAMPLT